MCAIMEELCYERERLGIDEGKAKANYETATRMLKTGKYSNEEISLIADINISKIEEIASKLKE